MATLTRRDFHNLWKTQRRKAATMPRQPVPWRQLYAIARATLQADPTMGNFDWAETIKARILACGKTYPTSPDKIHAAMRAVENQIHRPPPMPMHPTPPEPMPEPPPLTPTEARAILQRLYSQRSPNYANGSPTGWKRIGDAGDADRMSTSDQVDAWRKSQPRPEPEFVKTARGWERNRRCRKPGKPLNAESPNASADDAGQ